MYRTLGSFGGNLKASSFGLGFFIRVFENIHIVFTSECMAVILSNCSAIELSKYRANFLYLMKRSFSSFEDLILYILYFALSEGLSRFTDGHLYKIVL